MTNPLNAAPPMLTDEEIDSIARDGEGDLPVLADLIDTIRKADTNGSALFALMGYRKKTRLSTIRAVLARVAAAPQPTVQASDSGERHTLSDGRERFNEWLTHRRIAKGYDADLWEAFQAGAALSAQPKGEQSTTPYAWMWQHEENGNIGFVDWWQVENGWQKANPRLKIVRPLYATPSAALALLAEAREALEDLLDTGFVGGPQGKRARAAVARIDALEGGKENRG